MPEARSKSRYIFAVWWNRRMSSVRPRPVPCSNTRARMAVTAGTLMLLQSNLATQQCASASEGAEELGVPRIVFSPNDTPRLASRTSMVTVEPGAVAVPDEVHRLHGAGAELGVGVAEVGGAMSL